MLSSPTPSLDSDSALTSPSNDGAPELASMLAALDQMRSQVQQWQVYSQTSRQNLQEQLSASQQQTAQANEQAGKAQLEIRAAQEATLAAQETLETIRAEAVAANAALEITRGELGSVKLERDRLRDDCASQEERVKEAISAHQADIEKHQAEIEEQQAEIENKQELLEKQVGRNRDLQSELLELYKDLRAEDLPTLILRIAVNLTQSDNGIFVEADGDGLLSDVGFRDLPPVVQESLYKWTRQAAQANEPVVQNEGEQLADGQGLVNLAALPVAVQSTLKGVILVANKRSGDYSKEDTELLLSIGRHAGLAMENRRLHCELSDSFLSTIAVLADAIEAKDAYTRGHCESVSKVAVEVGRRLGFKGQELEHIRYAALLHDVGKIGIPDGILLKPGKLLPEEFTMIQRHATIGRDLVARVPSLASIAPIILHHHERIDGSGYPAGLGGEAINLSSRIIGVVDAFDAMTTPRPYREPVSFEEALVELDRCAGTQFDQQVVSILSEVVRAQSDFMGAS